MRVIVRMDGPVAGTAFSPANKCCRVLLRAAARAAAPVRTTASRVILIAAGICRCSPTHAAPAPPPGTIGGRPRPAAHHHKAPPATRSAHTNKASFDPKRERERARTTTRGRSNKNTKSRAKAPRGSSTSRRQHLAAAAPITPRLP